MASNPIPRKWTVEEYFALEAESDIRHEFVDGDIFAMAGGTENHSLITGNTFLAIGQRVRGSHFRMHTSDMRVKISETKYLFPDFSVICGKAEFTDDKRTTLTNPTLCVEVTSPSSMGYDKNLKGDFYRSIDALQHYLVLDQGQIYARLYTRLEKGWLLQEFTNISDTLPLPALSLNVPLSEIYSDITFE